MIGTPLNSHLLRDLVHNSRTVTMKNMEEKLLKERQVGNWFGDEKNNFFIIITRTHFLVIFISALNVERLIIQIIIFKNGFGPKSVVNLKQQI